MDVTLRAGDFEAFFRAPFDAYGPASPYVSPLRGDLARMLDPARNPLFQDPESALSFWTAHRGGRVVGRVTAHVHGASNRLHGWRRGLFGFLDVADDADAARALLGAAEGWARARGLTEMVGNMNLTAMQQVGVVTGGHEHPPATDQVWSPPHVAHLLQENGYEPTFPMTTFEVDLATAEAPVLGPKSLAIQADPAFAFAPVTRSLIPARMEDARVILNQSFARNPMFVSVSHDEFHFQARDMKWVMDPRISAVLHRDGAPVACIICIPDLNPVLRAMGSRLGPLAPLRLIRHRMTNRRAVLIFSGVVPEWQGRGVNPVVLRRVILAAQAAGYATLGNTWIADVNGASLEQKRKSGARPVHRLHLFRKAL